MKKISGIYLIRNKVNDRVYVGHSNNIKKRWSSHRSLLKRNLHPSKEVQDEYNNQVIEDFEYLIIEECLQRDLLSLEKKWKDHYEKNTYNKIDIISFHKKIRRGKEAKAFKNKCSIQNQGESNPHCTKFNDEIILEIKKLIADGANLAVLAEQFGTTEGYLKQIKRNQKWKHLLLETVEQVAIQ